ncbi:hypothetical protein [Acinetobacter baumannii]
MTERKAGRLIIEGTLEHAYRICMCHVLLHVFYFQFILMNLNVPTMRVM